MFECYARILREKGLVSRADNIEKIVVEFVEKIERERFSDGRLPIAFGAGEDTYSLKYNLAFDKILGLDIFAPDLYESETKYYASVATKYGTPLDSRLRTTKADWLLWCAALDEKGDYAQEVISQVRNFLSDGAERYPFPDWYDVDSAAAKEFRNRTVAGGLFMPLLKDKLKK